MDFVFQNLFAGENRTHEPLHLQSVVLRPSCASSYHFAIEQRTALIQWLALNDVVRRGRSLHYAPSGNPDDSDDTFIKNNLAISTILTFLVVYTEPVQEGLVKEGVTQVVVLPWNSSGLTLSKHVDEQPGGLLEINESFLAGTNPSCMRGLQCTLQAGQWDEDNEYSLHVTPHDLGQIGMLDGGWALVNLVNQRRKRLVQVYASPNHDVPQRAASANSLLVYNIAKSLSYSSLCDINLIPACFGCNPPRIPVARAITVARVASPLSTDRSYQDSFLRSLHGYFATHRRLVQQEDIIMLVVNTDHARYTPTDIDEGLSQVDLDPSFLPAAPNETVFFKVTNVEYDVIHDSSNDDFSGSVLGEWGCWVDTSATRILQTGIEHSRVPHLRPNACVSTALSHKLQDLVSASLTPGASEYNLELSILLSGSPGVGKMSAITVVAEQLGLHVLEVNCFRLIGESEVQTEGILRARFEKAMTCAPCMLVLRHVDALSQTTQPNETGKSFVYSDVIAECSEEIRQSWKLSGHPIVIVGTTDHLDQLSSRIMSCFKHQLDFNAPDESERESVLDSLLSNGTIAPDVSIHDLAIQTAALVPSDLADLAERGVRTYINRTASLTAYNPYRLFEAGLNINTYDLDAALMKARTSYAESIGAPKIPNVTWDDVGGLAHVKADILDTIQLPLEHPELFANGMKKRSGILLYGPPGTGKTLLAKAVATSCALNFFSVKGPELLNMYIGESEANVRKVFQRARDAKPCVIFFDELDSVAPKRGNHGDSGGVMDRIVSQLLAELDGIAGGDAGADVFVIGATNRPDLLDSALLRPGRFDRMLYLGVSQSHEAQLNILQALTRKFKLHPELSLERVAGSCPFHYTGADFYALCSDALLKAMSRKAEELDERIASLNAGVVDPKHPHPLTPQYYLAEMAAPSEIEVLVTQEDFDSALANLIPSVSQAEMDHYARVQQQFSKETINSV